MEFSDPFNGIVEGRGDYQGGMVEVDVQWVTYGGSMWVKQSPIGEMCVSGPTA